MKLKQAMLAVASNCQKQAMQNRQRGGGFPAPPRHRKRRPPFGTNKAFGKHTASQRTRANRNDPFGVGMASYVFFSATRM